MGDEAQKGKNKIWSKVLAQLLDLAWIDIILSTYKAAKKFGRGLTNEGMYKVLEHEVHVELLDKQGKRARIEKRQKVEYQQDNILAYEDQAWGDGEILIDYKCTPGQAVDQYRIGHKNIVLISLQEQKHRGDTDEFFIEWKMKSGFLTNKEEWGIEISHRTEQISLQIVFPKSRPPIHAFIIEISKGHTIPLSQQAIRRLPDGRWFIHWEKKKPRLNEHYLLRWEW